MQINSSGKTTSRISRRQFLIGAAGVGLVSISGAAAVALHQPPITFETAGCPTNGMPVLVAYASQYGTTGGVAAHIADPLCLRGIPAVSRRVNDITDLSGYRAVVLGGPIIAEHWIDTASGFVETHRQQLREVPVAYFLTCMALALDDTPTTRQQTAGVLAEVQQQFPEVQPVAQGLFAGALDYSKMSYVTQTLYRTFSPDVTSGDFRNWDAIAAWAQSLPLAASS